jgi:superfamily II DNA or RNA helicase
MNDIYKSHIYNHYKFLKNSNKTTFDNNDLCKIFEYYTCIKLTEEYNEQFYEYNDIDPDFKEKHQMSKNDTGIDCCNLKDTIVQCKLRKNILTWKECSTFFGSNIVLEDNNLKIKWNKMMITRNSDCELSKNLYFKNNLFIDKTYDKNEMINYCEDLLNNYIEPVIIEPKFELRDYQIEAINLIKNENNVIISIPTGCGKNSIIIHSIENNKKYLILVPRIILMEQLKEEIIKFKPKFKKHIQCLGDNNNIYNEEKLITICIFNSAYLIEKLSFDKIYIDEAHHINKPYIYKMNDYINENNEDYEDYDDNEDYDDEDYDDYDNEDDLSEDYKDDELINVKKYTQIIKDLKVQNNNVYLSATIDETEGFKYFNRDIRDMINLKYLCDYTITIPIFSDDPTNRNICEYLVMNYMHIIIYCNTQKEGILINKLLNEIQNNSSEYIDCKTNKKKRKEIIKKYKEGKIKFLVNVRILVEGFDAPITKGVCFLHLPNDKTTLIQIIGRCLRLYKDKQIANVILPYSCKDDEKNINNFLNVLAKNDKRIKKSYDNKKLGGYISIDKIENIDTENNDVEFKYNQIYNNVGKYLNFEDNWKKNLEDVKNFIDEHKRRPYKSDNKYLNIWLHNQTQNYKNNNKIMINEIIKKIWEDFINNNKYKIYFMSNEEIWNDNLNKVKLYMNEYNKRPVDKYLNQWIQAQITNYKNNDRNMKNEIIKKLWEEFINDNKYKIYFMSNEEIWNNNLNKVKSFMDENNKRPNDEYLNTWLIDQKQNYKNNNRIMKNEIIKKLWENFINDDKYKIYFMSNEEIWNDNLNKVKSYIDENNKRPDDDKYLNKWMQHQITNYNNNTKLMKNEIIKKSWEEFINNDKYKIFFMSYEEIWNDNLNKVKSYIDENNKRPDDKYLNLWLRHQITNYKNNEQIMKNKNIKKIWDEFINANKYKIYFMSNEEIWNNNLNKVKLYIDEHNKRPIDDKYLNQWMQNQTTNYKNNKKLMKNENIKKSWEEFINDDKYKNYFK